MEAGGGAGGGGEEAPGETERGEGEEGDGRHFGVWPGLEPEANGWRRRGGFGVFAVLSARG